MQYYFKTLGLLVPCLAFTSCVRTHIGEYIRSYSATYVGVDLFNHKKRYSSSNGLANYFYAPEVTYRMRPCSIIDAEGVNGGFPPRNAFDVKETGRYHWVKVHVFSISDDGNYEILKSLPEGCTSIEDSRTASGRRPQPLWNTFLGDYPFEPRSRGSIGAQMLAAPFDFVIDPVLSVVLSPLWLPFWYIQEPTSYPCNELMWRKEQTDRKNN